MTFKSSIINGSLDQALLLLKIATPIHINIFVGEEMKHTRFKLSFMGFESGLKVFSRSERLFTDLK